MYAQRIPQEDGTQKIGVDYVTLKSPNSWHLEFFGEDDTEIGDYKLTSLGKSKTKLTMVFKESWKLEKVPTTEEQVESTSSVWVSVREGPRKGLQLGQVNSPGFFSSIELVSSRWLP